MFCKPKPRGMIKAKQYIVYSVGANFSCSGKALGYRTYIYIYMGLGRSFRVCVYIYIYTYVYIYICVYV